MFFVCSFQKKNKSYLQKISEQMNFVFRERLFNDWTGCFCLGCDNFGSTAKTSSIRWGQIYCYFYVMKKINCHFDVMKTHIGCSFSNFQLKNNCWTKMPKQDNNKRLMRMICEVIELFVNGWSKELLKKVLFKENNFHFIEIECNTTKKTSSNGMEEWEKGTTTWYGSFDIS